MFKKILGLVGAAVMLFGVFGLAACTESLDDYKTTKKTELQNYADGKGQDNYCTGNWTAICDAVTAGKKAIADATTKPAVTTAYNDAKGVIDAIQEEDDEMADYILTITVDKATVTHGQKITASAVLKNNSGQSQDITIFYGLIDWVYMEGWHLDDWPDGSVRPEPWNENFEKDDTFTSSKNLLARDGQELGVYELRATATFYLNFGKPNEEKIVVNSNKISITVQ